MILSFRSGNIVGIKRPHKHYLSPDCHQIGGKTACLMILEAALTFFVVLEIYRRFMSVSKTWDSHPKS